MGQWTEKCCGGQDLGFRMGNVTSAAKPDFLKFGPPLFSGVLFWFAYYQKVNSGISWGLLCLSLLIAAWLGYFLYFSAPASMELEEKRRRETTVQGFKLLKVARCSLAVMTMAALVGMIPLGRDIARVNIKGDLHKVYEHGCGSALFPDPVWREAEFCFANEQLWTLQTVVWVGFAIGMLPLVVLVSKAQLGGVSAWLKK